MTRKEKTEIMQALEKEFTEAQAIVVCNYSGLSVPQIEVLRESAKEQESKVQVAKNTLARLALSKSKIENMEFAGTNIFVWGNDQISVSKVVSNFAKDNEAFYIKTAVVEDKVVDISTIEALSKLPGREELLGMLLSVWTAPARNFTVGLDNLRMKKEEETN